MIDRVELQRLWVERPEMTIGAIAGHFRVPPTTIVGIIRRARKAEGLARWPLRESAAKRSSGIRAPSRIKPGAATLPPLESLK